VKAAAVKRYSEQLNAEPDTHRFDGAFAAAKKHKPRDDVHVPKGHNREHGWILWSKIQRGHITNPATIAALTAEYGEMFKEFENKTYQV